jgi:hypothetical protein
MKATDALCRLLLVPVSCCLVSCGLAADAASDEPALTFFGWSDQHVQTDGNARHLVPAIDAMNTLPGSPYPERIGGKVAEPAFVLGCGDITEWPTHAAMKAYDQLVTRRLKFPAYDILGNHDEGGKVPSPTMRKWIVSRHGSPSYTFCRGGVHFIALDSKYDENLNNPAQPLTKEALRYVRTSLEALPEEAPVIVATHLCFDAITNRGALCEAFGQANVIAVLGGHYHKAKVDRYRGYDFVQLPSPAPGSPDEFTVLRVTSNRLLAIPYNYQQKEWNNDPKKWLDAEIRGPRHAVGGRD